MILHVIHWAGGDWANYKQEWKELTQYWQGYDKFTPMTPRLRDEFIHAVISAPTETTEALKSIAKIVQCCM